MDLHRKIVGPLSDFAGPLPDFHRKVIGPPLNVTGLLSESRRTFAAGHRTVILFIYIFFITNIISLIFKVNDKFVFKYVGTNVKCVTYC